MARRALNLLTATSLLLSLAAAALWVRSYRVLDDVYFAGFKFFQRHDFIVYCPTVRSAAGGIVLTVCRPDAPVPPEEVDRTRRNATYSGWEVRHSRVPYPRLRFAPTFYTGPPGRWSLTLEPPQPLSWRLLGVDWKVEPSQTDFASYRVYRVVFPYWMPAALLALLPAVRLRSMWRERSSRRRSAAGLCPSCGYNLTGNLSGVCPECGAPALSPTHSAAA